MLLELTTAQRSSEIKRSQKLIVILPSGSKATMQLVVPIHKETLCISKDIKSGMATNPTTEVEEVEIEPAM